MKSSKWFVLLSLVILVLTDCGSPTNFDQSSLRPDVDMLAGVQRAVNEYREDTGVLPIKTRDQDTDIFIKYLIDFEKLIPKYIGSPPANGSTTILFAFTCSSKYRIAISLPSGDTAAAEDDLSKTCSGVPPASGTFQ